ncbi:MAG: PAS domain-containing sensor histidine kinase [Campylobacterales bacterium]|nr:PAS domain-containing sensor histidine kinase [Campylobacterales bacterium]
METLNDRCNIVDISELVLEVDEVDLIKQEYKLIERIFEEINNYISYIIDSQSKNDFKLKGFLENQTNSKNIISDFLASDNLIDVFLDNIQIGFIILDEELNILKTNNFVKINYPTIVKGKNFLIHLNESQVESFLHELMNLTPITNEILKTELNFPIMHCYFLANIMIQIEDDKKYYMCQLQDITYKKMAENELKKLQQNIEEKFKEKTKNLYEINNTLKQEVTKNEKIKVLLEKSEKNYKDLIESLPDAIIIHYRGEVLFINDEGLALFEKNSKYEVEGKMIWDFINPQNLEDIEIFSEDVEYSLSEALIVKNDGTKVYVEAKIVPTNYKGYQSTLIVLRDVSKRKEMQKQLEELNNNLQEEVKKELNIRREQEQIMIQQSKMATMGEMMGMIAHQWRQPLNAVGLLIQSFEDIYEDGELDETTIRELIKKSMNHIEFMSKTIDNFRNFFRVSKDKTNFNLKSAILYTYEILEAQLEQLNIKTILNLEDDIEAFGLQNEFKQTILNILNNAKDAILEKKEIDKEYEGVIEITVLKDGANIKIIIKDNANGIKQEILNKIFEPYFSTKDESVGTGIGLYMSKMIIERNMNGKLDVISKEGDTRFIITLPIV